MQIAADTHCDTNNQKFMQGLCPAAKERCTENTEKPFCEHLINLVCCVEDRSIHQNMCNYLQRHINSRSRPAGCVLSKEGWHSTFFISWLQDQATSACNNFTHCHCWEYSRPLPCLPSCIDEICHAFSGCLILSSSQLALPVLCTFVNVANILVVKFMHGLWNHKCLMALLYKACVQVALWSGMPYAQVAGIVKLLLAHCHHLLQLTMSTYERKLPP